MPEGREFYLTHLESGSKEYLQVLERWKQVIKAGGSIDTADIIFASIRVSSVIVNEVPKWLDLMDQMGRALERVANGDPEATAALEAWRKAASKADT